MNILDTFRLSQNENILMPLHIQRTIEACKLINPKILAHEIQHIYNKIAEKKLLYKNDMKCRLEIDPFNLSHAKIQISDIDKLPSKIILSLSKNRTQKAGFGIQNYKTTNRVYWNSLSENTIGVNTDGNITETSRFNIFIKKNNIFYTPHLNSGCLNGCLRKYLATKNEIKINNDTYPLVEKNFQADEIILQQNEYIFYIGNSLRGIIKAHIHADR